MKTDLELLTQTLERYREQDLSLERRLAVLTDLEYYLHQVTKKIISFCTKY